jgi:putative phosphoserine phosphatase / 1-acylglycerol-3-phosphate O-acyltransferase
MTTIQALLDGIAAAPSGPSVGAFFDFDGTLIDGYSAAAFFKERFRKGDIGLKEALGTVAESVNIKRRGDDVSELMRVGVAAQAGRSEVELDRWAQRVFRKRIASMYFAESRALLAAHREKGHTIVIASSATLPQIAPAADDLGVNHIICTLMEFVDGTATGRVVGPLRWGAGKADGVREFAETHGVDLSVSFAYGNGEEDVPYLETVGHPCALNPDDGLRSLAHERAWTIAELTPPPSTGPLDVARSAAAVSVFASAVGASAGLGVLNRSRRVAANVAGSTASDFGLAAAGVQLNVVGEENVWSQRPAVFLFNHQSQLDVFVLGAVLRRDFTGVAKKELEFDPLFGPVGFMADVAFIDRANNANARDQLEPVVEALRQGRSIAIAPEGTRSPTEKLLPFKKGPFHIAMQANVPVVPVVIRNCGKVMAPRSFVIHPGTVDVAVLPPISTEGWTKATLKTHVDHVRGLYLETLSDWPEPAAGES